MSFKRVRKTLPIEIALIPIEKFGYFKSTCHTSRKQDPRRAQLKMKFLGSWNHSRKNIVVLCRLCQPFCFPRVRSMASTPTHCNSVGTQASFPNVVQHEHVVPGIPQNCLHTSEAIGCNPPHHLHEDNPGEASSCMLRQLEDGARMEVLLRNKAFKPKAQKGGAAITCRALLGYPYLVNSNMVSLPHLSETK